MRPQAFAQALENAELACRQQNTQRLRPAASGRAAKQPARWCSNLSRSRSSCSSGCYRRAVTASAAGAGGDASGSTDGGCNALERLAAGGKRVAVLRASKTASLPVKEQGRPLAEYMVLPASQYSVLDAQRVERLEEGGGDTFRCHVGEMRFLSLQVEPVITVSVTVQERGPTVRLLSTKLRGSKAVEAANDRFDATMSNEVRWEEVPPQQQQELGGGGVVKQIVSVTSLQVALQVPAWFLLPVGAIERSGSAVLARVLDTAVPRFLAQLAQDYGAWAAGDESLRQAVSEDGGLLQEGELLAVTAAAAAAAAEQQQQARA